MAGGGQADAYGLFLFCEPLVGWRQVTAGERRAKADWAVEVAALLIGRYAAAEKVILVCDNLNTHTIGAFYEAFEPATARELVRRLGIRHTPKHGSWLNVAECELSAMTRQCVSGRRFGNLTSCWWRQPPARSTGTPASGRRLAVPHRRRAGQANVTVSQIGSVTEP